MAEPKTKKTNASVKDFIAAIDDDQKRADAKVIAKIMQEESGEKAYMMGPSIIGFGAYKTGSGEWPMVCFAPRKSNIVLYLKLGSKEGGPLLKKLGKHKTGKGCLYLNKLADVDQKVLRDLVASSVSYMRENHECV